MKTYNYLKAVKADVREWIDENVNIDDWKDNLGDIDYDRLSEHLNDELFITDSVTGNASGSYTFNMYKAEEYLCHNWDILEEAMSEFCCTENPIEKGAEWCDVTIRCYLLGQAISAVLEEIEEENN